MAYNLEIDKMTAILLYNMTFEHIDGTFSFQGILLMYTQPKVRLTISAQRGLTHRTNNGQRNKEATALSLT